ncbi:MAG: OmpA family protein [Kiritimatiellae bacterium]|nr:OmpA family protein [Kiritimatiellia bacterium]MBR1836656.1 OmpA family protein [Kiritimatiellia bacterium]
MGVDSGLFAPGEGLLPGGRFDQLPPVATPPGVYPVYFAYNDSSIPAGESSKIGVVADFLASNPGVVLVVEGNCDERGTNEYNMSLGEYRAQAVRDALGAQGVAGDRVQTVSYGEERPLATGHDEASWRENRRADFAFYKAN